MRKRKKNRRNSTFLAVTPIRALRLTVRLNRADENDCRVRTMETPQTPGKERRVARVVQQKKITRSRKQSDGSYESSDVSDSSESEENNEEEEEESGWRKSRSYNAECMNQYGRTPVNEDALWRGTLHLAGSALLSFVNPAEARFRRRIKLVPPVHEALSALKIAVSRHKEKEEKQGIPIHERQFV